MNTSKTCDYVEAIKLAKKGRWDAAHTIVQKHSDKHACLIHGYLHRVDGDLGNASYWYNRAGEKLQSNSLEEEIDRIYRLIQSS